MRAPRRLGLWCAVASFAGVAALAAGCSSTPPPVSTHNLERPSDMVFACVGLLNAAGAADGGAAGAGGDSDGGTTTPVVSGRPMYECNAPGRFDPLPDVTRRTFAFVANSARGELSVLDLDNSKLIDLDLGNPETNVAPLGVQPEQISASSDGCRIVSANRGSCDLTLVDVGTLMSQTLAAEGKATVASTARTTVSQEIVVRPVTNGTPGAPLRVSPQEIMFLPQDTSAITGSQNLCARSQPFADPIGWNATPTVPVETQWKALATFPTCNLVALIDLPSGYIVDSMKVNVGRDGVSVVLEPTGSAPVCPVQDFCDGHGPSASAAPSGGADGGSDAGSSSPGSAAAASTDPYVNPNGTRPSSLAILPGGGRAYVGLTQASFVVAVDVQQNHLAIPASGGSILLHEGALGADGLRLSVDPYQATGIPGQLGGFVGEGDQRQRQYLYVIARDGTVRVVDVSRSSRLIPESECDVNVDPKYVPITSPDPTAPIRSDVCWPTDPPDLAHRRPLARGPGIRLPTIPRDVAFANLKLGDNREAVLDGSYAFILTSNGAVYEVNIDPTLRTFTEVSAQATPSLLPEVQPLVNSLRDQNMITFSANMDPTTGPARVDLAPTPPPQGPQLEGINTTAPEDNATDATGTTVQTYVFFPQQVCTRSTANPPTTCDATAAPNSPPMNDPQRQTWNITWEGDLFGPTFSGQFAVDPTTNVTTLKDAGIDFCQAGTLPGDFVTIFGCTADTQCGPLQVCRRSPTAPDTAGTLPVNGLCVFNDPVLEADQLNDCGLLLNSVRRYEITAATSPPGGPSLLTLRPKIDEVVSVSLSSALSRESACISKDGARLEGAPCGPPSDPTRAGFTCQYVEDMTNLRCVQTCGGAADGTAAAVDCRSGRSCVFFPNAVGTAKNFCADAPALTQDLVQKCHLDQLTGYKVGVGSGFLMQGTAAQPFVPAQIDPTTFSCEPNPARLDRIPYFQTVNGVRTVMPYCPQLPTTSADLETQLLAQVHVAPNPDPCVIQLDDKTQPLRALFQNREVRFVLLNLDSYLGDEETITFDVHGGFQPDAVVIPTDIDIDTPNRILVGPVDSQTQVADLSATHELPYLFVVDQRRLGRAAAGVGPTRGQILRINPRRATTADANSLLPIYDDSTTSNGLWPIQ